MLPIVKYLFRQYVHCADKRAIPFNLTIEEFSKLIAEPCVYCGATNSNRAYRAQYAVKELFYNGIDRINSDQAYTVSNCVAACGECNAAKTDMPLPVFLQSSWLAEKISRVSALRSL